MATFNSFSYETKAKFQQLNHEPILLTKKLEIEKHKPTIVYISLKVDIKFELSEKHTKFEKSSSWFWQISWST